MYISELIEDFLEHLEVESGRSPKTIENYRLYLYRFLEITTEILDKDPTPEMITTEVLRKYRLKLNRLESPQDGENLKTITQAYHLIALRGFMKYLAKREIKSLDPSLIELPHIIRKQVTFLHYDEVEANQSPPAPPTARRRAPGTAPSLTETSRPATPEGGRPLCFCPGRESALGGLLS